MTEQELRALVRDAIARHAGTPAPSAPFAPFAPSHLAPSHPRTLAPSHHAALFVLPSGPGDSCIIEPAVMCNHCGYCKSYGH
jgi:hypothetical protein